MWRGAGRRGISTSLFVAGLLGASAWAAEARAGDPLAGLALTYEAPAECPSRDRLEGELRARMPERRATGADARRFEVHIERAPNGGYAGRLVVLTPQREPNVREIRAASCADVSRSLVVFLAIALDPAAAQGPRTPQPAEEPGARPPPPPPPDSAPARATSTRPRARAPEAPPPRPVWTFVSGYQLTYLRALEPAWGGRVHAEIARSTDLRALTPAARLSYGWSGFSLDAPLGGEASFRLRTARLEACVRIAPSLPGLTLAPCAMLDIGTLSGTVPELPRAGYATTRWTAAGALLRGGFALTHWLTVELEAGLLVPLERTRFALVDPFRFVYRPPAVLFEGGLGASVSGRF